MFPASQSSLISASRAVTIGLGVLLEMKLAALPRHGGKDGGAGGLEADVVVAGDELDPAEAALDEALHKAAPVNFRLAQGDAHAQDSPFAIGVDAEGEEHGAVAQLAVLPDFFVAGIQDEIGKCTERTGAPFLQFVIQQLGALADLGGTDGGAAKLFDAGGDAAGGDALDIHFGEGELKPNPCS